MLSATGAINERIKISSSYRNTYTIFLNESKINFLKSRIEEPTPVLSNDLLRAEIAKLIILIKNYTNLQLNIYYCKI